MRIAGIILVVAGILMLAVKGVNWTSEEHVAEIGPIEINREKEHSIGWPVYLGAAVVVVGIVMIVAGAKKQSA